MSEIRKYTCNNCRVECLDPNLELGWIYTDRLRVTGKYTPVERYDFCSIKCFAAYLEVNLPSAESKAIDFRGPSWEELPESVRHELENAVGRQPGESDRDIAIRVWKWLSDFLSQK